MHGGQYHTFSRQTDRNAYITWREDFCVLWLCQEPDRCLLVKKDGSGRVGAQQARHLDRRHAAKWLHERMLSKKGKSGNAALNKG